MSKRFVIGDIHGGYKALIQVLKKSKFDYKNDQLICLGDVADGWSEVKEIFEELFKIKNLIYIMGNHDEWLYKYLKFGLLDYMWTSQGGKSTIKSYVDTDDKLKVKHLKFLNDALYYYISDDNKVFVHGGFDWKDLIENQSSQVLIWDRHLIEIARYWDSLDKDRTDNNLKVKEFDEVFVGHTTTTWLNGKTLPLHYSNVWDIDTGAGWEGVLTIMDIDTKEYWQSDKVSELYPDEKGRK